MEAIALPPKKEKNLQKKIRGTYSMSHLLKLKHSQNILEASLSSH